MTVGAPYSQGLSAAGSDGPYTYSTINTLPSGLTLSAAGLLSGTPTMKSSGLNFDVKVTDVSTMIIRGKHKRVGSSFGRNSNWKKAIVTLAKGTDLDVFGATAIPGAAEEAPPDQG